MQHWELKFYKVCINGDPELTLTLLTARSNLVTWVFFMQEKVKPVDVRESKAACDLKVGRC